MLPGEAGNRSRERLLLAAALGLSALIRIPIYAGRPSLWIDEARLALSVGTRSYRELLKPLDYDQAAPPLFLWATKLAVAMGGMSELALRALPLVAGLFVPALAWAVGRRLGGTRIGLLAAFLCAASPGLVRHVAELKPYQLDAFIGLALICTYLAERRPGGARLGPWIALLGSVSVWASTTAVFVLGALALLALAEPRTEKHASGRLTAVPALVSWTASFVAAYWLVYRHVAANPYLRDFWRDGFITLGSADWLPRAWGSLQAILSEGFVTGILELPAGGPLTAVAVNAGVAVLGTIIVLGVVALARRGGWTTLALLAGPWAAVVCASLLGLYPLRPRLTLFGLPLLAIAVAAGLVAVAKTRPPVRVGLLASFGVLFGTGVLWCLDRMVAPARDEHARPAVDVFRRSHHAGEPIYVFSGALPAWAFYTTDWQRPDRVRLARIAREGSSGGLAFENAPPRPRPVNGDGAHLVFPYEDWVEVLGVYHGVQWRSGGRLTQTHPDTNWTWSEARRIRMAANPTIWVLTLPALGLDRQLRAAVEAVGGVPDSSFVDRGAALTRYRFAAGMRYNSIDRPARATGRYRSSQAKSSDVGWFQ